MHNTEDKAWWVVHGATKEEEFVSLVAPQIGLKAEINPEKLKDDYAPDLVIDDDRKIADLKAQNTPFFTVGKTYRGYGEVNTFPDTVLSDTRQKLFRVMAQPFHWTKVT